MPQIIGGISWGWGWRVWCKGLHEDLKKYTLCVDAEKRGQKIRGLQWYSRKDGRAGSSPVP